MKLKANKNEQVAFVMRSGKDLVASTMTLKAAEAIVKNGTNVGETHRIKNYPLEVDDQFFFQIEVPKKKPAKEE